MSQEQSYLRVTLEETVWFKRGQEVEELQSISLDPNITITEQEHYYVIRGILELTGEYARNQEEQEEYSEEAEKTVQYVEKTEYREDGTCYIEHPFPIDIAIPKTRVANTNDVDVSIASFDYSFPEKACLRVQAELMIEGVKDENYFPVGLNEEVNQSYEDFRGTAYAEPEADTEVEVEVELAHDEEVQEPAEDSPYFYTEARKVAEATPAEDTEEVYVQYDQNYQEQEPPAYQERDDKEYMFDLDLFEEEEESSSSPDVEKPYVYPEASKEEEVQEDEESSPLMLDVKASKSKKEESISLTDFFARKQEEQSTRLRICIVQQGEELQTIADRYKVPSHAIAKANELGEDEYLKEGQVLTIPSTSNIYSFKQ
ncbi:stage VI sporulation protein D [Mangrovibacillus cuniculi]|uniref:Stage VI sporulation protein D n=1 Tax=Mangrovibacillus cuniculi TaxID=2593652 RepID=A0A7S8CBR0_9BACI|nr:stage VI sporulation protein D [Mangrovibacillus cuniculi]QPC47072.1 stage VI sporulation protein D [Mangrovibacillus cuniculi]